MRMHVIRDTARRIACSWIHDTRNTRVIRSDIHRPDQPNERYKVYKRLILLMRFYRKILIY